MDITVFFFFTNTSLCCHKPFSQCQHSFQMKAVQPLAKMLVTAQHYFSKTAQRHPNLTYWIFVFIWSYPPPKLQWPTSTMIAVYLIGPWGIWMKFWICIFKLILVIDSWGICCEIALIWMSLDFTDDQSTLVQVMAWCHQATSQYLSQCWPRTLSSYGIKRP